MIIQLPITDDHILIFLYNEIFKIKYSFRLFYVKNFRYYFNNND